MKWISALLFGVMTASLLFLPVADLGFDGEETFTAVEFLVVAIGEDLLDEFPANLFALVFLLAAGSALLGLWLSLFGSRRGRATPALAAGIGAGSLLLVPVLALVTGGTLAEIARIFVIGYWVALGSAAVALGINVIARSGSAT
jgi:hypothetical protein